MRAIICNEFGAPLALEQRPDPEAGPGQLEVAVSAAGLNYVDALFVRGEYQIKPPLPFIPGGEIAGTVLRVGEGVEAFATGDRILAMTGANGFAERAVVGAENALPIPAEMSDGQAAAFISTLR